MGSEERRTRVLEAIVRDYVSHREPVGSRALVEKYRLGVSPATVRNDMSVLEDEGLIAQPHTSAGRIPTDLGYRTFVNSLQIIEPLSPSERRAMERLMDGAVDLDDVIARAVRLLAGITHQAAVVQYPSLNKVSLRHLELIGVGDLHALLVIITEAGRVEQRTLVFPEPVAAATLEDLARTLNNEWAGKSLDSLGSSMPEHLAPPVEEIAQAVSAVVESALRAEGEERIMLAGTANLSRHHLDFARSISPVLEALEEQVVLLKLLGAMQDGMSISIGEENQSDGLSEASVISSTYDVDDRSVARVGIIGPTRMDYPGSIAAVQAVARYLSEILSAH
ncbi:heat-inducible transcriptional repressor HrcA [Ancrocorticia populi]|uniref:Heat-inducible transcription repressor HrcA n=1 Tax=Ancrocorticia populi TaxID=2175228 RepID=A0A2V1KAF3_9ACTO|nr:heat-inducible transcriptional repressor HrcA [Ancrocorticia populi]MDN6486916.1 heat-inducible transcriptional repressor HrcA [Ancrocorticia sp.]PWF26453.1 heat-inducible transcriptional repressor HrcA [Ancrocorticia populi]